MWSLRIAVICLAALASLEAAHAEDLGPTLQRIKETGAITLGYRENSIPVSYADGQQPLGFALDLCAIAAGRIREKLGLAEIKTGYKAVAQADAVSLLGDGTIGIDCAATAASGDIARKAGFSAPVFVSELKWIVPRKLRVEREGRHRTRYEIISPASADDLRGRPVVFTKGAGVASMVLTLSNDRSLGLSIIEGRDNAESFKLFESGKASAFLADDMLLVSFKASAKNPDAFGFLSDAYPGASYALMLAKDDKPFKELVDGALADAMKSGEYARLYAKWFESPIPPKNVNVGYPMPDKLKELVRAATEKANGQ